MKLIDFKFKPYGIYMFNGKSEDLFKNNFNENTKVAIFGKNVALQNTKGYINRNQKITRTDIKIFLHADPDVLIFHACDFDSEFIERYAESGYLIIILNCNHHNLKFNKIEEKYIHDVNRIIIGDKLGNF